MASIAWQGLTRDDSVVGGEAHKDVVGVKHTLVWRHTHRDKALPPLAHSLTCMQRLLAVRCDSSVQAGLGLPVLLG